MLIEQLKQSSNFFFQLLNIRVGLSQPEYERSETYSDRPQSIDDCQEVHNLLTLGLGPKEEE
jgi:hypothetical protein